MAAAVVGLAASAFLLVGNEPSPDVVAGSTSSEPGGGVASPQVTPSTVPPKAELHGPGLSIREISSSLVPGGEDFVIVFDGPVPDQRIAYVEDIRNVGTTTVAYTTQEWTPETPTSLLTCGAAHGGFTPPVPSVGQADVLIPREWFSAPPDADEIVWKNGPEGFLHKTPLCGYEGYVQYAIWSPMSHDPDDITVYFDGDTRLVVEIRPGNGG